jgi:acetyl esterase/lipase
MLLSALLASGARLAAQQLGPRDLDTLPITQPTVVVHYGSDSLQFGELRLPPGQGPFPVAVVIHGGCWRAEIANLRNSAAVASALPPEGIATWNIEYRRLGNRGGGWPGTFADVGAAIDYLRVLASQYPLDLARVVLVGHSAGAHLAVWAAGRPRLSAASPIRGANPLTVRAAVAVDGPMDLAPWVGRDAQVCGQPVIAPLMGGPPTDQQDHYREGSPAEMLPLGVPVYLVFAKLLSPTEAEAYQARARSAGDSVTLVPVQNSNHFQVMAPAQPAWLPVRKAIRAAAGLPAH